MTSSVPANGTNSMPLAAWSDGEKRVVLSNPYAERNSLTFVFRLPTETMEIIFIQCARDYHYLLPGVYHAVPAWVHVSYVCRKWRTIALNCATLWTYHFVVSPRWTEELLARSKNAPLKVYLDGFDESWLCDIADQTMDRAGRIEDLKLNFSDGYLDEVFCKLSASPAPRLRNLDIYVDEDLDLMWDSVLFNGDTPALHTLRLEGCPVPWYSFKLSGLTTLDLSDVPVPFRQSMADFLTTLSCMPGLTYLTLQDALASAAESLSGAAFDTLPKIHLLHLSRLFISSPLSTITVFLSCVTIPLATIVRLGVFPEDHPSLDDFAQLSSLLSQRINASEDREPPRPPIRSLVAEFQPWGPLHLKLSESERDLGLFLSANLWGRNFQLVPLNILIRFGEDMMDKRKRFFDDIVCALPQTNIQSIHVVRPPALPAFWKMLLGRFRDVSYIKLSQGFMPNIFPPFRADLPVRELGTQAQDEHATSEADHIAMPGLKELELHEMVFSKGDDPTHPAITLRCLLDALSRRSDPGRLKITRCEMGGSSVSEMVQLRWNVEVKAADR